MAADAAIFVGWNRPVAGRDLEGLQLFGQFLEYLGQQQKAGAIESFEPVGLEPHGGDLTGFCLIRGSRAQLNALRQGEVWLDMQAHGQACMTGLGFVDAFIGEGMQKQIARAQKYIK